MYDFESDRLPEDRVAPLPVPSLLLTVAELPRLVGELGSSLVLGLSMSTLGHATGAHSHDGGGRPVLVLPGFHASDGMTFRLRSHLRGLGYDVHGWGLGRNHGLTDRLVDGVVARLDEIADGSEQPVAVVGWSFGGMLARWVAHQRPDTVRQVVTLGSPWRREGEQTRATRGFEKAAVTHGLSTRAHDVVDQAREPLPVMSTAIWSRTDGVVPWRGCTVADHDGPGPAEDIEVPSSHVGLVSHPLALVAVADRLAQDPADPQPFAWRTALARAAGQGATGAPVARRTGVVAAAGPA